MATDDTPKMAVDTQEAVAAAKALTEIGNALEAQGFSLEDMIESGREVREELFYEQYCHLGTYRASDPPPKRR